MNPARARKIFAAGATLLFLAGWVDAADLNQAQGVVRGSEEALLSSEMAGRILAIADEGRSFRKEEVLVDFSCDIQRAEEDVARAGVQAANARLDNLKRLQAVHSAGKLDVALAHAASAEALAQVRAAVAKTRLCQVLAPYDGVVLKREVKPHESVNVLSPLLRIAQQGALEVAVIVSAAWLPWLKVGTPFTLVATPTGQRVEGKITKLGGAVDSSSQTVEMHGLLMGEFGNNLRPGMAGTVTFHPPENTP